MLVWKSQWEGDGVQPKVDYEDNGYNRRGGRSSGLTCGLVGHFGWLGGGTSPWDEGGVDHLGRTSMDKERKGIIKVRLGGKRWGT